MQVPFQTPSSSIKAASKSTTPNWKRLAYGKATTIFLDKSPQVMSLYQEKKLSRNEKSPQNFT